MAKILLGLNNTSEGSREAWNPFYMDFGFVECAGGDVDETVQKIGDLDYAILHDAIEYIEDNWTGEYDRTYADALRACIEKFFADNGLIFTQFDARAFETYATEY